MAKLPSTRQTSIDHLIDRGPAHYVGINFEDRIVKGDGLYAIDRQAQRIAPIRQAAEKKLPGFFINARTDLFLGSGDSGPSKSVGAALDRAKAYAAAGASGFFSPGLQQSALIEEIVNGVSLPVNVMVMDGVPSNARLALLGVARISYGPIPYAKAMKSLGASARKAGSRRRTLNIARAPHAQSSSARRLEIYTADNCEEDSRRTARKCRLLTDEAPATKHAQT